MSRRIAVLVLALVLFLVIPTADARMDCYPAKVYVSADKKSTTCLIDHEQSCMWCNVTVILE